MKGGIDELAERLDALKQRVESTHRVMVIQIGLLFFLVVLIIMVLSLGSFALYKALQERPTIDKVYQISRESSGRR